MKSVTRIDGRSARWADHRIKRRAELLRNVRAVIAENGADISMEQISAYSRTTKAVLYRYFGDRAGLQQAMGEWAMTVIRKSLDEAVTSPTDPRTALTAMVEAFVNLAGRAPEVYRFCDSAVSAVGAPADSEAPDFFSDVTRLLCHRMNLTEDTEVMWAYGAIGFVRSCTERWLLAPQDPNRFAHTVADWLWHSHQVPATPMTLVPDTPEEAP